MQTLESSVPARPPRPSCGPGCGQNCRGCHHANQLPPPPPPGEVPTGPQQRLWPAITLGMY